MDQATDWKGTVPEDVGRSSAPVAVHGVVHPKHGKAGELLLAWNTLLAPMRAEPGFEQYVIHTPDDEPGAFFLYERWASGPHLLAHLAQPYMQAFFARLPDLLDRPFVGRWVRPITA